MGNQENKEDNYGNQKDPSAKRDTGKHPNTLDHTEPGTREPKAGQGNETTGYTGNAVTDYEDTGSDTRFKFEGSEYVGDPIRMPDETLEPPQQGGPDALQGVSINPRTQSLGEASGNDTTEGLGAGEPESNSI